MYVYRLILSFVGGYILTALVSVSMSILMPFENQAEAIMLSSILSFIIWIFLILLAFSNINLKKLIYIFFFLGLLSLIFNLNYILKI